MLCIHHSKNKASWTMSWPILYPHKSITLWAHRSPDWWCYRRVQNVVQKPWCLKKGSQKRVHTEPKNNSVNCLAFPKNISTLSVAEKPWSWVKQAAQHNPRIAEPAELRTWIQEYWPLWNTHLLCLSINTSVFWKFLGCGTELTLNRSSTLQ